MCGDASGVVEGDRRRHCNAGIRMVIVRPLTLAPCCAQACNLNPLLALTNMTTPTPELMLITDEELQRLAKEFGPTSAEAQVLVQLATQRAQDLQVYAFRVGDQYVTGPLPEVAEPAAEPDLLLEALKRKRED
jgi:hypothetical protein